MNKEALYKFVYDQYFDSDRKYKWLSAIDRSSSLEEFLVQILQIEEQQREAFYEYKMEEFESQNAGLRGDVSELEYTNESLTKENRDLMEHNSRLQKEMKERAPNREILEEAEQIKRNCEYKVSEIKKENASLQVQVEEADRIHRLYLEAKLHF